MKRPLASPVAASYCYQPAEVLSPSQVNTFSDCPAKWCFRYLLDLPEAKSGALVVGEAVHATIAGVLGQKLGQQGEPEPELEDVHEAYAIAWAEASYEAEFREDEEPDALVQLGQALVEKYVAEAVPRIQPAALEHPVSGEIAGVKVRGRIDILDVEGRVIDIKTAGQKPGEILVDHRLQLITYDLLCPESRGKARLDTLVKGRNGAKNPVIQLVQQSIEIGPEDVQYAESMYPMVQEAMRDGIFYPRRPSNICSRRYCSFWRACEKEFGGKVKE